MRNQESDTPDASIKDEESDTPEPSFVEQEEDLANNEEADEFENEDDILQGD